VRKHSKYSDLVARGFKFGRRWICKHCANLLPLLMLTLPAFSQPLPPIPDIAVKPDTNKYFVVWVWSYPGTNTGQRFAFFLNSNSVSIQYVETTNTQLAVSNLTMPVSAYSAEIYSVGNGQPAIWLPTNYARAMFSTNALGPWAELPVTTMAYPPSAGFLQWTQFNNVVIRKQ